MSGSANPAQPAAPVVLAASAAFAYK